MTGFVLALAMLPTLRLLGPGFDTIRFANALPAEVGPTFDFDDEGRSSCIVAASWT
jgi:hypothetical protein